MSGLTDTARAIVQDAAADCLVCEGNGCGSCWPDIVLEWMKRSLVRTKDPNDLLPVHVVYKTASDALGSEMDGYPRVAFARKTRYALRLVEPKSVRIDGKTTRCSVGLRFA